MAVEPIIDTHHRRHDYLRLSLTERCNLRCFYCMPAEGVRLTPRPHLMTKDEILAIARTFVGLGTKKIRLTGGEPLVRKDAREIIEDLGRLGVELAITTNGVMLKDYVQTFYNAGIKTVNVSLDTLNRDKFKEITRRDSFNKVVSNIYLLAESGFKVKINVVVMRDVNHGEISDFVRLTKKLPIDVRFIEFMPFKGNQWNWEKGVSHTEIMQQLDTTFGADAIIPISHKPHETAKNYKIAGHEGSFGIISSVTRPFCGDCNRMRLTADGKMRNCLFSTDETDLLATLRSGGDLEHQIRTCILNKFEKRAGMNTQEKFQDAAHHAANRSMIAIGG